MKLSMHAPPGVRGVRRGAARVTTLIAMFSAWLLVLAGGAQAATAVPLGSADSFAVLAGTAITNVPTSSITGDVGLSPASGSSIAGLTCPEVTGTIYTVDAGGPLPCRVIAPALLAAAKNDLTAAYNNAAAQPPTSLIVADLGGQTLTPGVYNSASSIGLTGVLTLDARGDPNAVFIFQAGSTLTTASGSVVNLINGAQACNVFWQVGSSATLGTNSTFRGTILALTSISLTTGATVDGRVLARNGAVTMDSNTIRRPACAPAVVPSPPPGPPPGQVTPTPRGPIDTGDGSTSGATGDAYYLLAGALVLGGVGGTALVAARRRRDS